MLRFCLAMFFTMAACASAPGGPPSSIPVATPTRAPAKATKPIAVADTLTPLTKLESGWNRIDGGEGTECAHDSTYVFRVRPASHEKILIYLNGGGACWRAGDCDPRGRPTYTMSADSANDASVRRGIFDVSNPANPVRGYSLVFVPYCTGDMHLGARSAEYEVPRAKGGARSFSVQHQGSANVEVVLKWLYANVRSPSVVVVAGLDAGAVASPVVAEKIARHYPRARVVQFGEGAGGLRAKSVPQLFAAWGAGEYLARDDAFRSLDSADFTFARLYTEASRVAPRVRFSQYNTQGDEFELAFMSQLGAKPGTMARLIAADYAEIKATDAWFRSYTTSGKTHGILRSPLLYSTTVGGTTFSEWFTLLINGDDVQDVGERVAKAK